MMLPSPARLTMRPCLRMNVSQLRASLSIGHRWAWHTVEPQGWRELTFRVLV